MQDFNQQLTRPVIAIYDDKLWQMTLYRLDTVQDMLDQGEAAVNTSRYGQFKPIHSILNFKMLPTDVVLESGDESFIYMAR